MTPMSCRAPKIIVTDAINSCTSRAGDTVHTCVRAIDQAPLRTYTRTLLEEHASLLHAHGK